MIFSLAISTVLSAAATQQATITVENASGETLKRFTTTEESTVAHVLNKSGEKTAQYTHKDGGEVKQSEKIKLGDNITLVKKEKSGNTQTIELKLPEQVRENPEKYVDEETVVQEEVVGSAIVTEVVRKSVKNGVEEENTERNTVISVQPKARIVEKGTKQRPRQQQVRSASSGVNFVNNAPAYVSGNAVVDAAMSQVGNRYVWGNQSPERGFDCSGLVWWAYQQAGRAVPRVAASQGAAGVTIPYSEAQPGDLLYTSWHVAIYIGDGKIVHASTPERGVVVDDASWFLRSGAQVSRL